MAAPTHFDLSMTVSANIMLLLAALCAAPAAAASDPRPVTQAERKGFFDFYQKKFPDDHSQQPAFAFRPQGAGEPVLVAHVDSPPKRGLRALCRMERRLFENKGGWSVDERRRQFVWLDAKGCSTPARPVELQYPMPDADVAGLLEHERDVLKSARLLFGGNSQCASRRALNFSLARIEIGTSGSSAEVLAGLVFRSDRDTTASVWVRRSGLDYNAWNVNCQ
jgi:hypothetical protein